MWICVQITIEAIESDTDEIALQGIEFWSTVCDEEVDLAIELSEVSCALLGGSAFQRHHGFPICSRAQKSCILVEGKIYFF